MDTKLEEVRDQQKKSWNHFSKGWKKWDTLTMDFLTPVGEAMIASLQPTGNEIILDIASGTGEPGLTIATRVKKGKIILTDVAEEMLAIAKTNAENRHIKNMEAVVCDVSELPFEDDYFDAISCRFGFMFFPDMQIAAKEMARVLKPGGKMVTSVWHIPEKNFWITVMMNTIKKNVDLPQPPADAPGMFRCSKPGLMKNIFETAGFQKIKEKEILTKLNVGTKDTYWEMMTEVGAPIVAALSKADEAQKDKIKKEVFDLLELHFAGGNVAIDGSAIVFSAEK